MAPRSSSRRLLLLRTQNIARRAGGSRANIEISSSPCSLISGEVEDIPRQSRQVQPISTTGAAGRAAFPHRSAARRHRGPEPERVVLRRALMLVLVLRPNTADAGEEASLGALPLPLFRAPFRLPCQLRLHKLAGVVHGSTSPPLVTVLFAIEHLQCTRECMSKLPCCVSEMAPRTWCPGPVHSQDRTHAAMCPRRAPSSLHLVPVDTQRMQNQNQNQE